MEDRIGVPLELDDFEVLSSNVVEGVLEVEVRSTFPAACFHCGSMDVVGHGKALRHVRDRTCAYPTVLIWHQRRYACPDCGRTSRERHRVIAGRRRVTCRFRRHLSESACHEPFSDVARRERVSHYRVVEAFDALAEEELAGDLPPPRVVSLDESAFQRGHRFQTILFDPEAGTARDMAEDRTFRSAVTVLAALKHEVRAGIETAVIDCHWPFRRAIEAVLPDARVVADKFHVLRSIDGAAHKVRIRHGRKHFVRGRDGGLSRQHNARFDPKVKTSRWLFMRRLGRLTTDQLEVLGQLFEALPEVGVAWWMKEAFAAIYDAPDRTEAARRLDVWVANLEAAGLEEFHATWRTLQWWRDPILNYFDDRQTNAFAEGLTNKIKVMKRRAYGFRDPLRYRRMVLMQSRRRTFWCR
jgi:transposase